ncbi:MAG: FtsX-like permease family protein [Flavobacteriales bacterium]|nr:FtsX-like permease family protein [Flavobacteriales bacterium]
MLLKIAWRNIWRNRTRSIVVITAIAIGLLAGVFASAFMQGMMRQKIESVIKLEMSDFQFHRPQFTDEFLTSLYIPNADQIMVEVEQEPTVAGTSGRLISMGMVGSARRSGAIRIMGIDPAKEALVTGLNEKVVDGTWFEGASRNPLVISRKVAEKYGVDLKSKLVLTVQDLDGEIIAGAFRVVGIFDTGNGMFDEMNIYVRQDDLRALMRIEAGVHEIAVSLTDHDMAEPLAAKYRAAHPELEVLPWLDLATGMRYMIETMDVYLYFIVGIILVALLFSILNTMLMAVLERVREIGVLMAVGMAKRKVFGMILFETVMLTMIGGPLGLLLSWGMVSYFGQVGIDLGGAYNDLGFASIVYPYLDIRSYFEVAIMVAVMAVIAAVYPARKALKLIPVEAIRTQ